MMNKGKISILGCGWLGVPLAKHFIKKGFSVKGSVTNPLKFDLLHQSGILPFRIAINEEKLDYDDLSFFDCDVLILSIPPGRSTGNVSEFPQRINNLIPIIKGKGIQKVIFISSTSVYPDNLQVARESNLEAPDKESGLALLEAENLLDREKEFKTTILRFGGLIGADRNPARFIQKIATAIPNAPVNLIHLDDCVGIISEIIEQGVWGETFNACCPEHPLKSDFYRMAAQVSGMPEPLISDVTGFYKIVDSSKIIDRLNYRFIYPNPMDYLGSINKTKKS